jgi:hypothetical protein
MRRGTRRFCSGNTLLVTEKKPKTIDRNDLGLLSRYPAAPRRLLTVDEYHRMGEASILTDDDRVVLTEGELVAMAPIGSEHVTFTNALTVCWWWPSATAASFPSDLVRLNRHSEPQPTIAGSSGRSLPAAVFPRSGS